MNDCQPEGSNFLIDDMIADSRNKKYIMIHIIIYSKKVINIIF